MKPIFTIIFILCILMCISIYYSTCESDPVDPKPSVLKPFGYKIDNVKDKAVCVLVNEAPNAKNGIYPNLLACDDALHGLEPKPKSESRPFGFKIGRVKDTAVCVLVNEAPNEKNGVYSNLLACQDAIHGLEPKPVDPKPESRPFGFKIDTVKDKAVCILVNEAPNEKNGVYSNLLACQDAIHGLEPKPVDPKPESRPFGFKIDTVKDSAVCILVNEAPNEKNGIYSNLLACEDALHGLEPKPKPVIGQFGYKFTDDECIRVSEAPNPKTGVYTDMMNCYKETARNCNCKK